MTADYLILPVFQGHPGDHNQSLWPCSTGHFPHSRQKAASACQGFSKGVPAKQLLFNDSVLYEPNIQMWLTQPLFLDTGDEENLRDHLWSKPPSLLTLEPDRWKPHVGQPPLCILVQMHTEKAVRAELRQWEAWREGGHLLLEITLKHITNLLNHCGLPCISE